MAGTLAGEPGDCKAHPWRPQGRRGYGMTPVAIAAMVPWRGGIRPGNRCPTGRQPDAGVPALPQAIDPQLAGYQASIERMRRSPYMDYPSHVHLETLAICNAACTFCPYPTLERQGTRMADELIAKVIADLAAIPRSLSFQLSPFKVNEPFLDVRLFDILAEVNERLPHAPLTLPTHAHPV